MKRTVVWTRTDRDVPVGRKDDDEGDSIGSDDCSQSGDDRITREDGNVVHRDDVSADILATNVADTGGRGAGDDTREVTTLADMARRDLEPESGMVAFDGLCDGVQSMKGVVGDDEIQRGEDGTIGRDMTIRGQKTEGLNIRRRIHKVVHALVKACMRRSFDKGAGQIKIIQNFESARIAQENAKSRIRDDTAVA
jgi:hypothetical protein